MKKALVLAVVVFACGKSDDATSTAVGKSIFALTSEDFDRHSTVASAAMATVATDVTVQKGDVLLLEATGSITVDGKSYGPNGDGGWGGTSCTYVNRPVYALYGVLGTSVFPIGTSAALLAPQSGTLSLAVNGCAGSAPSGGFSVTVHNGLKGAVKIASEPSIAENTVIDTSKVVVDAAADWTSTGISVVRGQKVFVDASGTVSDGTQDVDANGILGIGGLSSLLVNRHALRLHGRIGQSVVELGVSSAFLAPTDGLIELAVNHGPTASGRLDVTIARSVVPAQGLVGLGAELVKRSAAANVPVDGKWHPSTLSVTRGDPILLSATGTVTTSNGAYDAFGMGGVGGTSCLLTNSPVYAVHARVGEQFFFVGGENAVLAPGSGTVELAINSVVGCDTCKDCSSVCSTGDIASEPACFRDCVDCASCDTKGGFDVTLAAP